MALRPMLDDSGQEDEVKEAPLPLPDPLGCSTMALRLMLGDNGQEDEVKEAPLPLPDQLVDVCCFTSLVIQLAAHLLP
jgi:hypothetical protein